MQDLFSNMLEKNIGIKKNIFITKLFNLLIEILILEEKYSSHYIHKKVNIGEFNYLLENIKLENLYELIKKHKLYFLISKSIFMKKNLPSYLYEKVINCARIAKKSCLENIFLTCEIYRILKKENIEMIFLKGPVLSLQTTNSIFLRGPSKDIDILIKPHDLIKTINILLNNGFKTRKSSYVYLRNDLYGRYSRNVNTQMILFKEIYDSTLNIDLHWNLSFIKNKILNESLLFNNREYVYFKNLNIPTLNKKDALIHASIHNAIDDWKNLRGVLDFERLIRNFRILEMKELKKDRIFVKNCLNCYQITNSPELKEILLNIYPKFNIFKNRDIKYFTKYIISKTNNKNIFIRFSNLIKHIRLTNNPNEIIKIMLKHLFPPKDFWNEKDKRFRFFHEIWILRIKKIYKLLRA